MVLTHHHLLLFRAGDVPERVVAPRICYIGLVDLEASVASFRLSVAVAPFRTRCSSHATVPVLATFLHNFTSIDHHLPIEKARPFYPPASQSLLPFASRRALRRASWLKRTLPRRPQLSPSSDAVLPKSPRRRKRRRKSLLVRLPRTTRSQLVSSRFLQHPR